jgi:hypothetical protein
VFSGMIPDAMESYRQVLEDRGMEVGMHGSIMFGRLK